jgi:prophage regulatory protein
MDQRADEIVRLADLPRFTGLRRTQIQHYIDKNDFPRPIRLGVRAKGWLMSEIRSWQNARIAGREQKGGGAS